MELKSAPKSQLRNWGEKNELGTLGLFLQTWTAEKTGKPSLVLLLQVPFYYYY